MTLPASIRKRLVSMLFRLIFTMDFADMDEQKRFETYQKMNGDPDIKLLIRSMYTRNFHACTLEDNHDMRLIIKGRMLQLKNFIDMMEGAADILENWEKRQKKLSRMKELKNRLLNNNSTV